MAALCFLFTFLLFLIEDAYGSYCSSSSSLFSTYCEYGCCGSHWNRHCCQYTSIGLIVGCSVAGIIGLIIIIVCICACVKAQSKPRRAVAGGAVVAMTSTTTSGYSMQQPPPYSTYPSSGSATAPLPPAYPPTGFQPYPPMNNPPPAGFHPPSAPLQSTAHPPPNYNDLSNQQPFSYGVQR